MQNLCGFYLGRNTRISDNRDILGQHICESRPLLLWKVIVYAIYVDHSATSRSSGFTFRFEVA